MKSTNAMARASTNGASSPAPVTSERLHDLTTVLQMVRSGEARTRPELGRASGMGRTVITQRLEQLMAAGLIEEGELGASTGGRAPRELRFRAEAGVVLVAELGATGFTAGIADLAGTLVRTQEAQLDISRGPDEVLQRVAEVLDELLAERAGARDEVWGVGIGLPGPVEFATGRPSAPPIMPGWDGYPVREQLAERFAAPVWVDNEVNLMALGECHAGGGRGLADLLCVKIGTGVGAGLISAGHLHRGHNGCAGDIGHAVVGEETGVVCRCGKIGCLEALASGSALQRDGRQAAIAGGSAYLKSLHEQGQAITAGDVAAGAQRGDPACVELLKHTGSLVGNMLATLVSFYNPSMLLLGGGVAGSGDVLLAALRESVYRRSLPLATRDLRISRSELDEQAGVVGAAFMVLEELFAPRLLGRWIDAGSPAAARELLATS